MSELLKTTYDLNMNDKFDCRKAVRIYPLNLCKTNDSFRNDANNYKDLIKLDPFVLVYATDKILDNFEIALEAVKSEPWLYRLISKRLRDIPEIIEQTYVVGMNNIFEIGIENAEKEQGIVKMSNFKKEIIEKCLTSKPYDCLENTNDSAIWLVK